MYYKKISISRFERFFTAICIAISAINLIVSFLVAGYWYGKSSVIPYSVLVICNFILLEFVLYSVINGMSDIGSQLDRKSKKSRKDVQEKAVAPVMIAPKVIEPATTVPTPVEVTPDNPVPIESVKEEPVSQKTAEDSHVSEPTPALQPSAKRLGMDLGYSTKTCGRFIKTMFPDLCIKRDHSQCTEEYLANNLLEEKDTDFIKIDKPDPHSIAFHFRDGLMKQAS